MSRVTVNLNSVIRRVQALTFRKPFNISKFDAKLVESRIIIEIAASASRQ